MGSRVALENRQKNNSKSKSVPPEVKQYYASEHRERVGLAWLIAFLSLIVTVAVVAGLFFGGRWAYRKIVKNDTPPSQGQGVSNLPDSAPDSDSKSRPNDLQPSTPPPSGDAEINTSEPSENNSQSNRKQSDSQPESITNTGPGSTLTVFVAVSILAAAGHWQYQRRRNA